MPRSTEYIAAAMPRTAELPPLSRLLVAFGLTLARWENRARSRAALNRLDPHLLADIGLTDTRRHSECTKPFWRD